MNVGVSPVAPHIHSLFDPTVDTQACLQLPEVNSAIGCHLQSISPSIVSSLIAKISTLVELSVTAYRYSESLATAQLPGETVSTSYLEPHRHRLCVPV